MPWCWWGCDLFVATVVVVPCRLDRVHTSNTAYAWDNYSNPMETHPVCVRWKRYALAVTMLAVAVTVEPWQSLWFKVFKPSM